MTDQRGNVAAQPLAYSPAEAARVSGLGRTTIYKLMSEGRLAARKVGSRTLIPAYSLKSLIEGEG